LLAKGQKTELELTHVTAENGSIEANIINQINTLTWEIEHLTIARVGFTDIV
jgi:hypothetical protein